jgi:hypothetical protein
MVELPRVSRQTPLTENTRSRVSPADVASPFRMIAGILENVGAEVEEYNVANAQEEGQNAVSRNPDGSLAVTRRTNWTRAGRAYNDAATQAYAARWLTDYEAGVSQVARDAAGNVETFDAGMTAYNDRMGAQIPEELRGALAPAMERETARSRDGLIQTQLGRDTRMSEQALLARYTLVDDRIAAIAMNGGTTTADYVELAAERRDLAEARAANPLFEYSPEQMEIDLRRAESRDTGFAMTGRVRQVYNETGSMAAARAEAERLSSDPALDLTPTERRQFGAMATEGLDQINAERRAEVEVLQPQTDAILDRLELGVGIDDAGVDAHIASLSRLGPLGAAQAQRIIADRAFARFSTGYQGLPNAEQLTLAEGAVPAANQGFEARLITRESGGRPGVVNEFGYVGLYQFGAPRLAELGLYESGENMAGWSRRRGAQGKWNGTFNIPGFPDVRTLQDFRNSPEAQRAAFAVHIQSFDEAIAERGLEEYIGQTIGGVQITREGIYAMMHLGGEAGAARTLRTGGGSNARDANGTSLLAYAAMGAGGGPDVDPRAIEAMQAEVTADARANWSSMRTGLDAGYPPSASELDLLERSMRFVNDEDFRAEVADHFETFENGYLLSQLPPDEASAFLETLRTGMGEDGFDAVERETLEYMGKVQERQASALAEDPLGYRAQIAGRPVPPLDTSTPDALGASLAARQTEVMRGQEQYRQTGWSALRPDEAAALSRQWEASTAEERAGIVGSLAANLRPETLSATLAGFAGTQAETMAVAGSLQAHNPAAAAGVIRGEMLLQENAKLAPADNDTTRQGVTAALPPIAFGPGMEGARQDVLRAVRARYADLSATAGDESGEFNDDRFGRAVQEVTGGLLEFNNETVIAPRYGMAQEEFDGLVAGLTDQDLTGAVTESGAPITAEQFWNSGARLRAYQDGRYFIEFGSRENPTYAGSSTGGAFVLDLRPRGPFTGGRF